MEKVLRVGVLGMGNMGKAHARSLMKMENVKIAGLCSSPADDARAFACENHLDCGIYDDGYRMIEDAGLDALYICLPPFAHSGQLEAAADRGIHVFIEKPIALNVERGKSMADAVERNHIVSQVGYHMRFGSAVRKWKEYMDSGKAGRPTLYMADYECNSLHGPWWRDVTKCGGQVFEQVIHLYDMGLYLMGDADCVNGHIANLCHQDVEGYTIEDTSVCSIHFKNGSLGSICGSNCSVKEQWNGRFRVICQHMTADFMDHNHAVFTFTDEETPHTETVAEDVDATYLEDCCFIETIRGRRENMAGVPEGLKGLQLVSAVVESSAKNGACVVPE